MNIKKFSHEFEFSQNLHSSKSWASLQASHSPVFLAVDNNKVNWVLFKENLFANSVGIPKFLHPIGNFFSALQAHGSPNIVSQNIIKECTDFAKRKGCMV